MKFDAVIRITLGLIYLSRANLEAKHIRHEHYQYGWFSLFQIEGTTRMETVLSETHRQSGYISSVDITCRNHQGANTMDYYYSFLKNFFDNPSPLIEQNNPYGYITSSKNWTNGEFFISEWYLNTSAVLQECRMKLIFDWGLDKLQKTCNTGWIWLDSAVHGSNQNRCVWKDWDSKRDENMQSDGPLTDEKANEHPGDFPSKVYTSTSKSRPPPKFRCSNAASLPMTALIVCLVWAYFTLFP